LSATKVAAQKMSVLDSLEQAITGKQFPSFNVRLSNGSRLTNADLRNKIVFVSFWFVKCPPCMAEMPGLNKLYDSLKNEKDFLFLSFTFDTEADVKPVIAKYKIPFKIIHISKEESTRLGLSGGYPTNMILDKRGRIKWVTVGGGADEEDASPEIVAQVYPRVIEALKQ
jgi:cytochrome c biogenesis protein CcmG/thiol:disulfide interchange protein DsbE